MKREDLVVGSKYSGFDFDGNDYVVTLTAIGNECVLFQSDVSKQKGQESIQTIETFCKTYTPYTEPQFEWLMSKSIVVVDPKDLPYDTNFYKAFGIKFVDIAELDFQPIAPLLEILNTSWNIMNDGPLNNDNIQKVRYALIQTINALGGNEDE